MYTFNREKWINEECVPVKDEWCDACPYVVYDKNGVRKCDMGMKYKCETGEMYGDEEES